MAKTKTTTLSNTSATMSKDGAQALVTEIQQGMALISDGYMAILPQVAKLDNCKGYKALGYDKMDDCALNEFGMSHGTVCGIRKVFKLYGNVSAKNEYSIPNKYKEYGYTKLLFFASDINNFETAGIDPFEVFTPSMTIKEMKSTLALALADKASEQDKNAIDVTEDSNNDNTTTSDNATTSDNTTTSDETEITPLEERLDLLEEISKCTKMLHDLCDDTIKAERLALLDAIIANVKDFEKEVKKAYK